MCARPFVRLNMASSLDGKITSYAYEPPTFTSPYDHARMDFWRAEADALIIGAGTLRIDNPPLHVRDKASQEKRMTLGKPRDLVTVVVSRSCAIPENNRFFTSPHITRRILATVSNPPHEALARIPKNVDVFCSEAQTIDVIAVLDYLKGDYGVESVLLEGGGVLNWDFAAVQAIDEVCVTLAPTLIGGTQAPTLLEGAGFTLQNRTHLELVTCEPIENELFLRYTVKKSPIP